MAGFTGGEGAALLPKKERPYRGQLTRTYKSQEATGHSQRVGGARCSWGQEGLQGAVKPGPRGRCAEAR